MMISLPEHNLQVPCTTCGKMIYDDEDVRIGNIRDQAYCSSRCLLSKDKDTTARYSCLYVQYMRIVEYFFPSAESGISCPEPIHDKTIRIDHDRLTD